MQWARDNGWVVFTHDLDFGILLAHSKDGGPSVIQVRTQDVSPEGLGPVILRALRAHEAVLESGALLTIDESKSRVRILPI
jgi:predicted nuclease of predicted toxin-antitoxin system